MELQLLRFDIYNFQWATNNYTMFTEIEVYVNKGRWINEDPKKLEGAEEHSSASHSWSLFILLNKSMYYCNANVEPYQDRLSFIRVYVAHLVR